MNTKRIIWIVAAIVGGVACLLACAAGYLIYQVGSVSVQAKKSSAMVGNRAPDFTLISLDQEMVKLSDQLDKPVFLCFGATWCPDCKNESPLLQQLHEQHPEIKVIWVDSKEDSTKVKLFLKEEGLTFKTLLDQNGKVAQQYMVWAIPTVFVIDTDGLIKARFVETLTQKQIDDILVKLGIEP
jgi:peroxiredoxin